MKIAALRAIGQWKVYKFFLAFLVELGTKIKVTIKHTKIPYGQPKI
jgi:hypothetical protein